MRFECLHVVGFEGEIFNGHVWIRWKLTEGSLVQVRNIVPIQDSKSWVVSIGLRVMDHQFGP